MVGGMGLCVCGGGGGGGCGRKGCVIRLSRKVKTFNGNKPNGPLTNGVHP